MKCKNCPNQNELCWCVHYKKPDAVKEIVWAVAQKYKIPVNKLRSKSREQEIVRVRNIAMKRCREAGISLSNIGRFFNRKHSTVIHALKGI